MPEIDLSKISEEELLQCRICDLPLKIEGTWLEECIAQLYKELEDRGLTFKPVYYLADEWLTPENEPVVGIPFYLAHPALIKLEKKMMLEAEGETKDWCMKLLRHETGHAISYAYPILKEERWQKIFGSPQEEYADTYRYRPYSKNYVRHLEGFYAQYHPEEDFVETFAVWLTPNLDWAAQYAGWKALDKLRYVDELMQSLKGLPPVVKRGRKYWHQPDLKMTLEKFYKKKRSYLAEEFPDFHDANLRKIFVAPQENQTTLIVAADVIRKNRNVLLRSVAGWTGEKKYIIHDLLKKIEERCRALKLVGRETEAQALLKLSSYLTTLAMNYIYTGWYRGDRKKRKKT